MAEKKLGSDNPKAYLPLGHIDTIENKAPKPGEPARWARVRLQHEDGSEGTFLLTFEELKNGLIRAETNKEDLPPEGLLQKLQNLLD
ncbi:hypothetical protein NG895_17745 [Aeoliella sp. ICT_H6.2]|uniref:Uncharacterized protein n=1 Tax=Aeoliella straminimaris TaxID=2954799 RepID=A0A9X2FBZ0_9BACT|nr:hypothetical protein [Aeoliella straminimaris]MCO6045744.1 hypothetical protein [Aeoliella straminimaris]